MKGQATAARRNGGCRVAGRQFSRKILRLDKILVPTACGPAPGLVHEDPEGRTVPTHSLFRLQINPDGTICYQFASGNEVPFEPFFVIARNTLYSSPTLEFLAALYGTCPPIEDKVYFDSNSHASVYDFRKAQRELGWHNFELWEK